MQTFDAHGLITCIIWWLQVFQNLGISSTCNIFNVLFHLESHHRQPAHKLNFTHIDHRFFTINIQF